MTEYVGQQFAYTPTAQETLDRFRVQQMLNRVSTATLVQVQKCTNSGGVSEVGTVDVLPLVNMADGFGKQFKHVTAYSLPYFRIQGGSKAVIMDPKAGDIGVAVFADRDISTVKKTKKQGPAGSRRRFSMADGLFFPCFLGGTPDTYVRFTDDSNIFVVRPDNICGVFTKDYIQLKKKGNDALHITIDVQGNQILVGSTPVVGPDPNPNQP